MKLITGIKVCLRLFCFLFKRKYKQTYKGQFSGTCSVLVNGPSLKKIFDKFDNGEISISSDSIFVNLSALDNHFWLIKPKHYCFSDPMFYQDYEPKKDAIRKNFKLLNENVDWDLNLYMCYPTGEEYDKFIKYSQITNPKIHFIRMNRNPCDSYPSKLYNRLLSSGYFMPLVGSVANVAVYVSILAGYKNINLYGADNNMFLEFCVNDNNQLCSLDSHFYDSEKPQMRPFINTCKTTGEAWRIEEYMYSLSVMFKGHDILNKWAKSMGVHILNCCSESMIDAYDRIPRLNE